MHRRRANPSLRVHPRVLTPCSKQPPGAAPNRLDTSLLSRVDENPTLYTFCWIPRAHDLNLNRLTRNDLDCCDPSEAWKGTRYGALPPTRILRSALAWPCRRERSSQGRFDVPGHDRCRDGIPRRQPLVVLKAQRRPRSTDQPTSVPNFSRFSYPRSDPSQPTFGEFSCAFAPLTMTHTYQPTVAKKASINIGIIKRDK